MTDDWIKKGRQKRILAQALSQPMTFRQLQVQIQRIDRDSRIQLRDIWLIVKKMEMRGLLRCISDTTEATGKVYALTDKGKDYVLGAFERYIAPDPEGVNWTEYGWVARAKSRREVLMECERQNFASLNQGWRPCEIRKSLNKTYPIAYREVLGVIKELCAHNLVECLAKKGRYTFYRTTQAGRDIALLLHKIANKVAKP